MISISRMMMIVVVVSSIAYACGGTDLPQPRPPHKFCINGVVYYEFSEGVTVGYNHDGTLTRCQGI